MAAEPESLLTTTTQIRGYLRPILNVLREEFDHIGVERRKTGRAGRAALGGRPRRCALCGSNERVEFAHLFPLEEGGITTSDNLIPLCGRLPKESSCHWLYDRRYASIAEMTSARESWIAGWDNRQLADTMVRRREDHKKISTATGELGGDDLQSLIANGHFRKAARRARVLAGSAAGDGHRQLGYAIREVECHRRRAARGALEMAARRYAAVERDAPTYPDLLPRLYYEGGYVSLLLGRHREAQPLFARSLSCAELLPGGSPVERSIAAGLMLQCVVAINGIDSPWDELLALADRAEASLQSADGTHAQRWIDNWNWHRVRIALIRRDAVAAQRLVEHATDHVRHQDALGGWSTGSLATRLVLVGSVKLENAVSDLDVRAAAELLTRSVVVLAGRARQYPEGLRDALYGLAAALERLDDVQKAELALRLREVAVRIRDGSSWSYPYRAD